MQLCAPKSIVSVSVPDEQFIPLRLIRGRKNEAPAWRLKHDWLIQMTKAKISSNVVLGLPQLCESVFQKSEEITQLNESKVFRSWSSSLIDLDFQTWRHSFARRFGEFVATRLELKQALKRALVLRSSSGTIICRRWQECDLSTSVGKPNWFAQTEPKQFLDSLRDLTLLKAVFLTPRIRLFVYQSKLNPHDHLEKTRKADPLRSSHFLWDRGQHGAWFHQNALIHPRLPWMVLCCNQCVL